MTEENDGGNDGGMFYICMWEVVWPMMGKAVNLSLWYKPGHSHCE